MRRCSAARNRITRGVQVTAISMNATSAKRDASTESVYTTSNRCAGVTCAADSLSDTGEPVSSCGPRTRNAKRCGSANLFPSIASKSVPTSTVTRRSAGSRRFGTNRTVTGSRHSYRPSIAGVILSTLAGSTARSIDPATGRSKLTEISVIGSVTPTGVERITRSGAECTASAVAPATASGIRRRKLILYNEAECERSP